MWVGELRRTERLLSRRENHEHVLAFEASFAFHGRDILQIFRHAIEQSSTEAGIRDLAAAKHDRHFDFAAVHEQPLRHSSLDLVVVGLDLGAKLHFLELEAAVLLTRVSIFLRLFVLQSSVIADPADRWNRSRRDFDQVEAALSRKVEGIFSRHYAELRAVIIDDADVADPNLLVYAKGSSCYEEPPMKNKRGDAEASPRTRTCRRSLWWTGSPAGIR